MVAVAPVPGPPGPAGPAGPPGDAGSGTYVHVQNAPSAEWTIAHGLQAWPNVTTVDSAGTLIEGDVEYVSNLEVIVRFSSAFGGEAYLS